MKNLFLTLVLTTSYIITLAQTGETFPELSGTTLKNKEITVPVDTKGKYTLVGMAYSKKAEDELETWMQPVYSTFIYKPKKPVLFRTEYDVNLFFIPMFTGPNAVIEGKARKKMEGSIDPKLHSYVLLYKGKLKEYKEKLDFEKKDTPYFFVLDEEGTIVYETSGAYTDDKMAEIESYLEEK